MFKLNKIKYFVDTHPIGKVFNLGNKKAVWKRVTELATGMKIAVAKEESMATWLHGYMANEKGTQPSDSDILWDEIVSIKKVGRERVYDIEVEGTHNFVGNGIIAHNTHISLTEAGDLNITASDSGSYKLTNTTNGSIINQISALGQLIVANIKSGGIIGQNIATQSFMAFQGTIDHMLITSGLVAGNIQTKLISPLADGTDVTVQIGSSATPSGQFIIQNAEGSAVVSIDNTGNATFSGTLYADEIKSKSLDDIQALLTKVQTDQSLLAEATSWNVNTASNSAQLDKLVLSDLYVTNQGAFNSLSVTNTLTVGSDLVIQSYLDPIYNILYTSIDTLSAPLKLQSLAMAPLEIMAGLVTIDTHGNVNIAGNLAIGGNLNVAGRVNSSGLTLKSDLTRSDLVSPGATDSASLTAIAASASLLSLQNNQGAIVASVDASGSAIFTNIQTQKITGTDEDRGSVEFLPAEDSKVVQREWTSTPAAVLVSPSYKTQAWVTDTSENGFTVRVSDSPLDTAGKIYWWALW